MIISKAAEPKTAGNKSEAPRGLPQDFLAKNGDLSRLMFFFYA